MRKAFLLFVISFAITTFLIAPFLQDCDQSKKAKEQTESIAGISNKIVELTTDVQRKDILIQSNNNTIQIQSATITSYQAENTALNRKLSDIESAKDPSAKAVKKRALILCKQLEDFYQDYTTNSYAFEEQNRQREQIELQKLGWPPPTNDVERTEWENRKKISDQVFSENIRKRLNFEAQWSAKFTTGYYGQMTAIRDQLASLGLRDEALDRHSENPFFTSANWSHQLTMAIEKLANQIKE
jgi:hypothetical protein